MANHLDLEEQEQLDQIKHFWNQYGNLITGLLVLVLGVFAAWNGYQYWEKRTAAQASVMFEEVEKAIRATDLPLAQRAVGDMQQRFPSTIYAQQSGLALANLAYQQGQMNVTKSALVWVAASPGDAGYAAVARLRLAGALIETKSFDEAQKVLTEAFPPAFTALVADRRGDLWAAQGKSTEAIAEYRKAWSGMESRAEYRRLVSVKLAALGATETAPL
ncbi:MAG: tetratricopeptide repeat protein [Rhodoferax sp.]|nr:tetratricopeptide repeat protein [Rhodoferax sp.]